MNNLRTRYSKVQISRIGLYSLSVLMLILMYAFKSNEILRVLCANVIVISLLVHDYKNENVSLFGLLSYIVLIQLFIISIIK
ncbi:hypothetical protein [Peptostreptococcus porci]|uniref:hypothetical protein n=1 Tax=Peptostreptococcus porci TaxID=2652282 RepID=UPI0023F0552E|nr:hypothetical protein [Peptostreptococcus porci]MDD7182621.1 hypothetical protein [Peptostreptococcus porci]MDY5963859.1 hypothetical protein [Peptostreptococcus porci]